MVSFPDELLRRLDARARRRRTTRSGLLRELAERELRDEADARRRAIGAALGAAAPHGGTSARDVRELRRSR